MVEIFGYTFEHISIVRAVGNPVYMYMVRTEEGYCIRKPTFDEGMYKTATSIYETDDFDAIVIIPISELPEGAEVFGTVPTPEPETI